MFLAAVCSSCDKATKAPDAFVVGTPQRLSVQVESKLSGGSGVMFGASDKQYELRATATLLPLSKGDQGTRIRASLEGISLKASDEREQQALDSLLPILREPALFTLAGGAVRDLRVSPDMQGQAYGWLQSVIGALQWPEGAVSSQGSEVEEADGTGTYRARLERTDSGLRKVKLRYIKLFAQSVGTAAPSVMPEVVHSKQTRSPAQGPLAQVQVDETLSVPLSDGKPLQITTRVDLKAVNGAPREALSASELAAAEQGLARLTVFSPPAPREGTFDADRVANATFDGVLEEIEQLRATKAEDNSEGRDVSSAYLERFSLLAAMLRQREADVERATALIRAGHPLASTLLQALASAGTESTQAVLRGFATGEDKVSEEAGMLAATGLIRVQRPAEPTVELLLRWADDPKMVEHGLYGLGTAARHLRERGQTERARAIADHLAAQLDKAKQPARVERVLRGIANSADSALFERVRARSDASDPGIRTAAIDALRFMEHPGVDALLLERARAETDTAPLRALLSTLAAREPSVELAKAVKELTTARQRYGVRFAAVEQAGKWLGERKEMRALLEQVSHNDEREEVRVLALKMLKPGGKDT